MRYRPFGNTGFEISALGFGGMRLPEKEVDGEKVVDEDLSVAMMHRAFEAGVNYVDTAYGYCGGVSEVVVGKAMKGWRDRVKLSTKLPLWDVKGPDDFDRFLDEQLGKLDVDTIDFYHFHGLSAAKWDDKVVAFKLLDKMAKAKDDGRIVHASFSFHDKPEAMRALIDSGVFSSVLCQYNLIDRGNDEPMAYARQKGLGVVVMGPVGGGRLGGPREYINAEFGGKATTPEVALRFVLTNPNVSCALSGMSAMRQVDQNVEVASNAEPLSGDEIARIEEIMVSRKALAELYCTGCGYCMPCPNEVNIPVCFECMTDHRVYKFTERAIERYGAIGGNWLKGKRADACVECGQCEEKCPQNIKIREQLKEVADVIGKLLP